MGEATSDLRASPTDGPVYVEATVFDQAAARLSG